MNKTYKNQKLNNLSHFEESHDIGIPCPICNSPIIQITNYMDQQMDGSDIVFCSEDESHIFEMDRRTRQLESLKKPIIN